MQCAELKYLEVRGIRWRYYVSGMGKKGFLFLSGMLGSGPKIAEFLGGAFPEKRVIIPVHAAVHSISDYLQMVESLWDRENISETAVYGASFGSLIAQCFSRSNIQKVSHLILSGAAVPETSRIRINQVWLRVIPFLPLTIVRMGLLLTLRSLLKNCKENRTLWQHEYRQLITSITKADLISRYKIAIDYDKKFLFRPDDFSSSHPILVLEGEADRVAGKKIRERVRSVYPHATVHVFRGAGHSILLTHPEEWRGVVKDFLGT
jgi:pimeloyl-ACP methyl ester carboxylesterase